MDNKASESDIQFILKVAKLNGHDKTRSDAAYLHEKVLRGLTGHYDETYRAILLGLLNN